MGSQSGEASSREDNFLSDQNTYYIYTIRFTRFKFMDSRHNLIDIINTIPLIIHQQINNLGLLFISKIINIICKNNIPNVDKSFFHSGLV